MEIDGAYHVIMKTNIASLKLKMTLKTNGNTLSVTTEGADKNSGFPSATFAGTVNGNQLQWSGVTETPAGKLKLDCTATLVRKKISGQSVTPFGVSPFEGTRE